MVGGGQPRRALLVGNRALMAERGVVVPDAVDAAMRAKEHEGCTVVCAAVRRPNIDRLAALVESDRRVCAPVCRTGKTD